MALCEVEKNGVCIHDKYVHKQRPVLVFLGFILAHIHNTNLKMLRQLHIHHVNALRYLDNNFIGSIPVGTFFGLTNLEEL
jgi:hypothetical protein